jgi:hypothetical protein
MMLLIPNRGEIKSRLQTAINELSELVANRQLLLKCKIVIGSHHMNDGARPSGRLDAATNTIKISKRVFYFFYFFYKSLVDFLF